MKLLYKGNTPTKAHATDIGFDLHPDSVIIVFHNNRRATITGLQEKGADAIEEEILNAIEENRGRYMWNSPYQGIRKLIFDSGTAIAPDLGMWMMLCANSRVCKSESLVMQNGVGIVDPGYRGHVKATYVMTEPSYNIQDVLMLCRTCGQLIPFHVLLPEIVECTELDSTERGEKGFGSSDTQ